MKTLQKIESGLIKSAFLAPYLVLAWVLFALSTLTGCATGSAHFLTATTNAVPTVTQTEAPVVSTTAQVVSPGVTNTVTVTNYVPASITNWTTNVVYAPSGTVQAVTSTISAANSLTGPINPFSGWITAGLALFGAGMTYYAKVKTTQANTHASVASTLISAVEGLAEPVAGAVKAAVTATSLKQGTATAVNNAVQTLTTGINKS
jgi:hypothetical protein